MAAVFGFSLEGRGCSSQLFILQEPPGYRFFPKVEGSNGSLSFFFLLRKAPPFWDFIAACFWNVKLQLWLNCDTFSQKAWETPNLFKNCANGFLSVTKADELLVEGDHMGSLTHLSWWFDFDFISTDRVALLLLLLSSSLSSSSWSYWDHDDQHHDYSDYSTS